MPKSRVGALVVGLATAAFVAGCGGGTPPANPPSGGTSTGQGPVATPAPPAVAPKEPEAGPTLPPVAYEAQGRRDPFIAVSVAREGGGITVNTVRLVGVVQGRQGLLALVEAPDGIGYILKSGDSLGDGRVTAISPNSVTFAVAPRGGQKATTLTLRLPTD